MILVQCNTCNFTLEVSVSPAGIPVLPKGWKSNVAIVENTPQPRLELHSCDKLECQLIGTKPVDKKAEKEEESWGISGTR